MPIRLLRFLLFPVLTILLLGESAALATPAAPAGRDGAVYSLPMAHVTCYNDLDSRGQPVGTFTYVVTNGSNAPLYWNRSPHYTGSATNWTQIPASPGPGNIVAIILTYQSASAGNQLCFYSTAGITSQLTITVFN